MAVVDLDENVLFLHQRDPYLTELAPLLPASKSESNRALIIAALCEKITGQKSELYNLSQAKDTQVLQQLLASEDECLDAGEAGTTFRFLTAYAAVLQRPTLLTGSARMQERPIAPLVEALRHLGATITYENKVGFPPLRLSGFELPKKENAKIKIAGNVSSQFISALLLIAPVLPFGLQIELVPPITSVPYIQMTLDLMKHFGILWSWHRNRILIPHQVYRPALFRVESDWSAASYWYAFLALAEQGEIFLAGLKEKSLQGDIRIVRLMRHLGVRTVFERGGVRLFKSRHVKNSVEFDFTDCPDLAQTVAVVCAAKGIRAKLKGLHTLRHKETDRLQAVCTELNKMGADCQIVGNAWVLNPSRLYRPFDPIATYRDHRMAMAFAPLSLLFPIQIEKPEVVRKSYPHFWQELAKADWVLG
jgi:3-phosphoshikimate 1-carboxyvinyltransferase